MILQEKREVTNVENVSVVYPCSQLLTLLLLGDQVLRGHLQLKLSQLMFSAHCPAKKNVKH